MNIKLANVSRQNASLLSKVMPRINRLIIKADFILGAELEEFEINFAKYCKKKYAVGVNSGTDAIKLLLMANGIGAGDEVITVPNGYFSTAMVISQLGATVVFVDVENDSYLLDVKKLEKAITKKTRAIIPVHMYGQSADVEEISKIAQKYHLLVIEDVCQAHGAIYKGKKLPFGDNGAFSFYPGKNLGCFGDGGAVVTNDADIYNKILYLRNDGSKQKNTHISFGLKSRLDDIQTVILNIKLSKLDIWNEKRRQHANRYNLALAGVDKLKTPTELPNRTHVYHQYVIQSNDRDKLRKYLKANGIETGIHYPIPIHLQKAYKNENFRKGDFPVAEAISDSILSLPMFPELQTKEIDFVANKIIKYYANKQ